MFNIVLILKAKSRFTHTRISRFSADWAVTLQEQKARSR